MNALVAIFAVATYALLTAGYVLEQVVEAHRAPHP